MRFFGAIHGIDNGLWQQLGYLSRTDRMPSNADRNTYWNQCQHGSWYFLPWHRGYLIAFEAIVRDAVVKLNGPADWALPYWNYFKPNQDPLPPAFASADWPDGNGDNPLFVEQRYGPGNDGDVFVPVDQINLNALADPDFTGVANGGSPGFGGVDTGFAHGGQVHGGIETQPHDWVHGLVGGEDTEPGCPG
jgi:tyrosinase